MRQRIRYFLQTGDHGEITRALERHRQLARGLRQPDLHWHTLRMEAMEAMWAGRIEEGEQRSRQALTLGERIGRPDARLRFTLQMLVPWREQGRLEELLSALGSCDRAGPLAPVCLAATALILVELGRQKEARSMVTDLSTGGGLARGQGYLVTLSLLAEVVSRLPHGPSLETLYGLLLPHAERHAALDTDVALGPVAFPLALLAEAMGRPGEAETHFRRAIRQNSEAGALGHLVRARHHCGRLLLRRGQPRSRQEALAMLGEARRAARELGMADLERAAEPGALPAGESASPLQQASGKSVPSGLTAREMEVLRLLAQGYSNRQIARELHVALSTVQRHVANMYRKMDVHRRAEAVVFALRGLALDQQSG